MKRNTPLLRRTLRLACLALLAACCNLAQGQPRQTLNFDLDWQLHVGDLPAETFDSHKRAGKAAKGRTVSLPRAFNGEEAFARSIYELTDTIAAYAKLHTEHPALYDGGYRNLHVWSKQLVFERACEEERILVAINIDDAPYFAPFDAQAAEGTDLLTGKTVTFEGGYELPPHSVAFWKV